ETTRLQRAARRSSKAAGSGAKAAALASEAPAPKRASPPQKATKRGGQEVGSPTAAVAAGAGVTEVATPQPKRRRIPETFETGGSCNNTNDNNNNNHNSGSNNNNYNYNNSNNNSASAAASRQEETCPATAGAADVNNNNHNNHNTNNTNNNNNNYLPPASAAGEAAVLSSLPPSLPPALAAALMPFQRAGVAFAVRRGGNALIGDDMGLGKTIQAIATCCAFRGDWPVLLVVPNSLRLVWADELERWIPELGPGGVNVVSSGQDLHGLEKGSASFHIVTYGILTRASPVREFLRAKEPCKTLVVDESHMIKNRAALRTREILQIAQRATRVLLLSGTPALARPVELYTQVEAVASGLLGSFSAFAERYCAPKWTPFGMDFTGASNLEELHAKLQTVMIRRLKKNVLQELPAKRRQRVQLEVAGAAAAGCAEIREQMQGCREDVPESRRLLMQFYKESSEAKAPAVCEYVEDLLNGGCKFLVFAHHLAMLDALEAAAVRCNVGYMRIDGSVNSAERLQRVASFQADPSIRIAVLSLLAAGVGITLTAASTVVFAELHWTPGVLVQAEDRAHRIGQRNSVNIHYLVASGTIDDIIWPSVSNKVEVVSAICDGQKSKLVAGLASTERASKSLGLEARDVGEEASMGGDLDLDGDADNLIELVASKPGKTKAESAAATKLSAFSVLSMLQGRCPAKSSAAKESWACGVCGVRHGVGSSASVCDSCGAVRSTAQASKLPTRPTGGAKAAANEDVIELASESEDDNTDASCAFWVSRHTGRVHVLSDTGTPLGANFKLADWEATRDSESLLPETLRSDPSRSSCVQRFLRQWTELRAAERRHLMDQELRLPLRRQLLQRAASTQRMAKRPLGAAADGDSPAPCSFCGGDKGHAGDAGAAFCSASCAEKGRVRTNSQFARKLLFGMERGICQVCGLHAQELFERVQAMTPPERHQELLRAGFGVSPSLLDRPHEGLFWQADHILPVSEGGGEADLTNLRTLCTPCHAKETRLLQGRLKCAGWAGNSADIRTKLVRKAAETEVSTVGASSGAGLNSGSGVSGEVIDCC
ncbi:unnamed protein product, partial [Polarella glacialis]